MNHCKLYNSNDVGQGGKSECLYSKIHRLYVKSKCKEEKQKELRISVELVPSANPMFGKSVTVQLTDDNDPCFLYGLALTEEDFKDLKSQQGLLIDFDHFPGQLLRLLAECGSESEPLSNRFLLVLDEPESDASYSHLQASLQILETSNFKHLCHLCLNISRGNDTEIKNQMALIIKHMKEADESRRKQQSRTESQLEDVKHRLEAEIHKREELQRCWGEEKTDLQVSSMRELTQEREKCANMQLEWQRRLAEERACLEEQHAHAIRGIESELARLRSHSELLSDKHRQAESLNKELSAQLEQLHREARQLERDCAALRKHNVKLDTDYHEKEKETHCLATRVAVVEQELKDKTDLISKQNDQLCSTNHKQAHLEESLVDKDRSIQKLQLKLKNASDDLAKANEILTKMQAELSCAKLKLKQRANIALEQERLLDTKQKELGEATAHATEHAARIVDLETEVKNLRETLEATRIELENKVKQARNSETLVNWMNRRLNEAEALLLQRQSNALGPAASTPLSFPSSAAFPPRKAQIPPMLEKQKTAAALSVGTGTDGGVNNQPMKNSIPKAVIKQDSRKNRIPLLSAYFPK